jgi:hypothetical protein
MKRTIVVMIGVLAALAIPVMAAAQPAHSEMTKKAELHVTQPLVVGTQTLKAGEYHYYCVTANGESFLVVTSDEDGKEIARVPCTPETLAKKAEMSDIRTVTRDGKVYMTAVRIKGELVMHRLVSTPGA